MDLILWVLEQEDDLHYYQGYHDICVTVLQVCGARLGIGIDCPLTFSELTGTLNS